MSPITPQAAALLELPPSPGAARPGGLRGRGRPRRRAQGAAEGGALWALAALLATTLVGLVTLPGGPFVMAGALVALHLWAAMRFGRRAVLGLLALLVVASLVGLVEGRGPFAGAPGGFGSAILFALLLVGGSLGLAADAGVRSQQVADLDRRAKAELQEVLYRVLRLALEPLTVQEILERTLLELFSLDWLGLESRGAVFLSDESTGALRLAAHESLPPDLLRSCAHVAPGRCHCGRAAVSGEVVFVPCVDEAHEIRYEGIEPHGHYCVPIASGTDVLGVLTLYVREGQAYEPDHDTFLQSIAQALAGVLKRRRAEEALRKSEERFLLAIQGTDAGIWDWDLTTNCVYYSPRWKSMLGYREEEVANEFSEWERRLHPEDLERARATIRDYLSGKTHEYELEHRLRHRDGTWRWILARGAVVRNDQGTPYRMVGSHLDVTSRHEAENALEDNLIQLEAAARIQRRLLPRTPPSLPELDIAAGLRPARFAAGDAFDYQLLGEGQLRVAVSDVCGHGLGPALLMASTHTLLRLLGASETRLDRIASRANAFLHAETSPGQFVTLFLLEVDASRRQISYVNAGHPAALLLRPDGSVRGELDTSGPALAIFGGARFAQRGPLRLEPGEILLLLTDGVLEARRPEQEIFGTARAREVVGAHRDEPSARIVEHIFDAVQAYTGREGLEDDATVVVIKDTRVPAT